MVSNACPGLRADAEPKKEEDGESIAKDRQSPKGRRGRSDPEALLMTPPLNTPAGSSTGVPAEGQVVAKLSTLDRFLPVWIVAAMVAGLLLGRLVPGLNDALDAVKVGETSLPIALGLLLMMYPVLAKVRYDEIGLVTADRRMMAARCC